MAGKIKYDVQFGVNKASLSGIKKELNQLKNLTKKDIIKIDGQSAIETLSKINEQAQNVEQALTKAYNFKLGTVNIESFNNSLKQSGSSIQQVYNEFSKAGVAGENAFRDLTSTVLKTNLQLKESHAILDKMAETFFNAFKYQVATKVLNSVTGSIQQAWGYTKALDTSLNDIRIVTGKSADEMARFAVQANEVAQNLGKSTTDYTNAALIYAQQGLSDKEVAERAAITLKAANVTGQSTDDVSEQLTAVWNGYKVTASEAQLYVDRLAAVAATTASDLEELSTGMSKVASAAAAMGVGQDQLAAQLSTIISVTKQAPESVGTALRTVYARISDIQAGIDEDGVSLGNYSGKMAQLGINVLNANGKLRDMGEVMEEIGGKWDTLTREQQVYLAQTMAGQRQYNNLLALFDNFEEYNKALNTAQNAAGTLQEQQDIYMESTEAHLESLKAKVEDIFDSLINPDDVEPLIDLLAELASLTANWIDGLGGGINILKSLGSVGLMVFGDQIAKSINISATNLQIARNNATQYNQVLDAIQKDFKNLDLTQEGQSLLQNRESLLKLAKVMTPEQFSNLQDTLTGFTGITSQIKKVNKEIEDFQRIINALSKSKRPFEDIINSGDAEKVRQEISGFQEDFQKTIGDFENFQEKVNDIPKLFKNLSFGKQNKQYKNLQSSITNYGLQLKNLAEKGYLSKHKEQIENISKQISKLPKISAATTDEEYNQWMSLTQRLKVLFSQAQQEINKDVEKITEEFVNPKTFIKLQQLKQTVSELSKNLTEGLQKAFSAQNIANFSKLAGGLASAGSAVQQLINLLNVLDNQDLSTGQKVTQIVTNLLTSLPLMTTGAFQAANAFKELVPAIALSGGQITAIILAISAGIGVVSHFIQKQEQLRKKTIEQQEQIIKNKDAIQEEIQAQRGLYKTLEELSQKYNEHKISRIELRTQIESLISQYGLQGQAAQNLRNHYDDLKESIEAAKKAKAEQGRISATEEVNASKVLLQQTAMNKGKFDENKYTLNISGGITGYDEPDWVKNVYTNLEDVGSKIISQSISGSLGYNPGNVGSEALSLSVENDVDSIVALYHKLKEANSDLVAEVSDDSAKLKELYESEYFSKIEKWLKQMGPAVEKYEAAIKDYGNYASELEALNLEPIAQETIQSVSDYAEARENLINNIKSQAQKDKISYDNETLEKMADAELAKNYTGLFVQFDRITDKIDEWKTKFGTAIPTDIEAIINSLNEDQLAALLKIEDASIKTWDQIRDFIKGIPQEIPDINPASLQQSAFDNYATYQSLEQQVKSGKTISKSEFQSLDDSLKTFFNRMANGTYKMQGDAQEFYAKVNSLKMEGLDNNLKYAQDRLNNYQALIKTGFNVDEINKNAAMPPQQLFGQINNEYDSQLVKKQLEYIEAVAPQLQNQVNSWREINEKQGLSVESVKEIADYVSEFSKNPIDKDILDEQFLKAAHQWHDAMFPTDSDIDQSALAQLKNTIQDFAKPAAELADSLEQDDRAAEDVAESILRFDDAVQDVVKNYDDWKAALANGSWQAIEDMRDAYADLLDLDGSSLSEEFLTNAENLDLMKAAIDGNTEAYDQLLQRAGQDIATQVHLDTETFKTDFDNLMDLYYQGQELDDMEIGAELNDENFLAELSNMVNSAGMSAQQATDYLASMGVDAQVIQQKQTAQDVHQYTDAIAEVTPGEPYLSANPATGNPVTYRFPSVQYRIEPSQSSETVEKTAFALKVTSAHKSSGGGFKFSKAPNGGGSKGQARRAKAGKSGGGGGKSGSSQGPDTSKKDTKKPLEDTRDIYHDINIELEQINHHLDRAQKKQDRLYGKQLLDNLNEQTAILEQHKKKLKQKQGIQQEDLKNQQKTLNNLGVEFDKYGNIANYMSLLAVRQTEINARTADYNKLIEQYNQSTDKTVKEQIAKEAEAINKQIQTAENDYKQLEKKIKDYDKLRQDMEDLVDDIEEETQKQIELNIQKFRMSLEIRLEMGEAERDWNQFRRKVLEHTDVLKGTEFEKIFADALQQNRDLTSYFSVGGSIGTLQALTNQLIRTRQEIQEIDQNGFSDIYGDNKAQAMEHLQKDLAELSGQLIDVEDLIDNINQAYLDTIDDIEKQFDKQIEDYEYIGDLIQHDIDLLELLYGDKNYNAMDKYFTTLAENNLKQLDSLRKQREFWGKEWEAAVARGDTNAAAQFEQNYKKTIKNLNKVIEDSAKNIQDKYTNAIEKIFDTLDKKLSDGKGTDYLSTQWQLMNKNADEYLDTINTAFAIQETEQKYQDAINDTKNIKNQQALKKLMDEQLGILKNKEKVTQYDVERAEKLLQIEQARIALQDMQSAKTTLRLKRDSQGNYSYQYVADDEGVDDARAKLAEAQNDLYNFDKERYKSNLDDMLAAWKDFQSEYKDIIDDVSLTEEQRIRNLALLREQYGQYINDKTLENAVIRGNLQQSAFNDYAALYDMDVQNYQKMTDDERNILMGELVPMWKSGIQEMADTITGEGGFLPACQDGFEAIEEATQDYKDELSNMADVAGISLAEVKTGVDDLASTFDNLVEANDDLITRMNTEINTIQGLKNAAANLVKEYQNVYGAAVNAVSGINDYIRAQQAEAAAAVSAAQYKYNGIINAAAKAKQTLDSLGFDTSGSSVAGSGGSGSGTGGTGGGSGTGGTSSSPLSRSTQRDVHISTAWENGRATQVNWYYDKKGRIVRMASGGYTGDWNSSDGKLAVLHEKELVLNPKDTSNILNVVKIVRSISDSLKINTAQRLFGLKAPSNRTTSNDTNDLEQNVHIEATFPNVDSKRQIEEAFDDLINLAAQRALR